MCRITIDFRHKWDVTVIPVTPAFQLEEKYDTYMLKNGFCGAFLIGFALHDEWMRQLETTTLPTVLFDNYIRKNPNVAYNSLLLKIKKPHVLN